ncbi:hypothetical protein LIER_36781 [Lithospermum erythrorhizon]|uniref:Uncharacterized protein n=1 Tax=Lithospermum erythrorhizon TaxID=34254 RepID=A0AAV3PAP1_LITER
MADGVLRIWTLKSEARSLPPDTENDLLAMDKICSVLPQDAADLERLSWYTYMDESILIKAGLVYDKEFDLEAQGDPPT